jgi:hypothetical protein
MPKATTRNNEDESTANVKDTIMVRVYRCDNADCLTIEIKAPDSWPEIIPRQI